MQPSKGREEAVRQKGKPVVSNGNKMSDTGHTIVKCDRRSGCRKEGRGGVVRSRYSEWVGGNAPIFDPTRERIESKKTDRRSRSMLEGRWRDSMGAIELRRQL